MSSFVETKQYSPGTTPSPEILAPIDLYPLLIAASFEPWWMARWKARAEFFLSVVELVFLSLTVEALQGKTCQDSMLSGGVGHLELRFQAEGFVPGNIVWFLQN